MVSEWVNFNSITTTSAKNVDRASAKEKQRFRKSAEGYWTFCDTWTFMEENK